MDKKDAIIESGDEKIQTQGESMEKELKKVQSDMDAIEKDIIANKKSRLAAGGGSDEQKKEAVALRDGYIKLQKVREDLLKQVLTKKEN